MGFSSRPNGLAKGFWGRAHFGGLTAAEEIRCSNAFSMRATQPNFSGRVLKQPSARATGAWAGEGEGMVYLECPEKDYLRDTYAIEGTNFRREPYQAQTCTNHRFTDSSSKAPQRGATAAATM